MYIIYIYIIIIRIYKYHQIYHHDTIDSMISVLYRFMSFYILAQFAQEITQLCFQLKQLYILVPNKRLSMTHSAATWCETQEYSRSIPEVFWNNRWVESAWFRRIPCKTRNKPKLKFGHVYSWTCVKSQLWTCGNADNIVMCDIPAFVLPANVSINALLQIHSGHGHASHAALVVQVAKTCLLNVWSYR